MDTITILTWAIGILTTLGITGFGFIWKHFNTRCDKIDARFDKIDARFDKVADRFDKVEDRLTLIEHSLVEIKTILRFREGYVIPEHPKYPDAS